MLTIGGSVQRFSELCGRNDLIVFSFGSVSNGHNGHQLTMFEGNPSNFAREPCKHVWMRGLRYMQHYLTLTAIAVATLLVVSLGSSSHENSSAYAGNACQQACDRAFADCYNNSGGDRRGCAVARARCLNKCLRQ